MPNWEIEHQIIKNPAPFRKTYVIEANEKLMDNAPELVRLAQKVVPPGYKVVLDVDIRIRIETVEEE